jgi:hypothetical protein
LDALARLSLCGGIAAITGVPQGCLLAEILKMDAQGGDLGFDALRVPQQQIALPGRRRTPIAGRYYADRLPQPGERNARAGASSWPKVITISLPLA